MDVGAACCSWSDVRVATVSSSGLLHQAEAYVMLRGRVAWSWDNLWGHLIHCCATDYLFRESDLQKPPPTWSLSTISENRTVTDSPTPREESPAPTKQMPSPCSDADQTCKVKYKTSTQYQKRLLLTKTHRLLHGNRELLLQSFIRLVRW